MAKQIGIIIVGHGSRAQKNNEHFLNCVGQCKRIVNSQ